MADTIKQTQIFSKSWSSVSLAPFSGRQEPGPLFLVPSHLLFFLPILTFCKFGVLWNIKFLKVISSKEALLAALGWGGPEARDPKRLWAVGESPGVFLHFDVLRNSMLRVVALNSKGKASLLETKAVIAIQWQHKLLHVQPSPICLAWELNGHWQLVQWLFLFILSSTLTIQDMW